MDTSELLEKVKNLLAAERTYTKQAVREETEPIKKQLVEQGKDIKSIKTSTRKISKDQKSTLKFLDKQDVELHKRVSIIEGHLNLSHKN